MLVGHLQSMIELLVARVLSTSSVHKQDQRRQRLSYLIIL